MSHDTYGPIRQFVAAVRTRQRTLRILAAASRAALAVAAVLLSGLVLSVWVETSALALAVLGSLCVVASVAVLSWALLPLRHRPSDIQLARFVEERVPSFEDRLVTAVDTVGGQGPAHHLHQGLQWPAEASAKAEAGRYVRDLMLRDASDRVTEIDLNAVFPQEALRRAGLRATACGLALVIVAAFAVGTMRRALDAAIFVLAPRTFALSVRPGDVQIRAGEPVSIEARVVGARAPVPVEVQIADGDLWRPVMMRLTSADTHQLALEGVTTPFRYRVVAGPLTSPTFAVTIARPPRVSRIDVAYTYPAGLGLEPRSEVDGGDVYAPAGTDVRISIHADRPVAAGQLTLGRGDAVPLRVGAPTVLTAQLKVAQDNSYRVSLSSGDGLINPGDTEYFIRVLEDRPPEVHVTKPAGDRTVTRLQEVEIEAQADDDYGIDRLELVYAVRGEEEQSIALDVPRRATSVTARHTVYLEDLDVKPGDFVSYYVRARDIARGARAREARSDIFFLDIRPFEQEFSLAQSQSMAGSGYSGAIDELVSGQRQVVVATWKLERRARDARGARSEQDIRAVARTEADLKQRAERTASSFRESTMRDPRRRPSGGASAAPEQLSPGEDAMGAAVRAMDRAVTALDALKTDNALPAEMDALNQLLRAQAEIKQRQVALDQSAAGAAGNANRNFDISTLFDEELRRQQQTSYESSKATAAQPQSADTLEAIRALARRQDELLRRQDDLASRQVSEEERKRQLEQLTRQQSELRQRAEELARQTASSRQQGQPTSDQPAALRDISDDMKQAAGDFRRGASGEAARSAGRARDKLRDLEQRMATSGPDEQRRTLGELQLEARQLADRQRQVASELAKIDPRDRSRDAMRRLAGEEGRLRERAQRLEDRLKSLGAPASSGRGSDRSTERATRAARDLEQERLPDRMRQTEEYLQAEAASRGDGRGQAAERSSRRQATLQEDVAKSLDRLADRLEEAGGERDKDSQRLSEQLARAERMKENLGRLSQTLESASPNRAAGERGRTGEGSRGAGGIDLKKLQEESLRQLREIESLVDELKREVPSLSQNGVGFTLEGQRMILSAPGTEAFKQDFAKWEALRRQASLALEQAQSSLSKKLQVQASKDRLPAGVDDVAPPAYQGQVDRYFKALATKRP